jgi:predicted nucleic acid-binding protein
MSGRTFVDTNILVYAHDADAGEKHAAAAKTVADLWESRKGIISTQVLQELYVTLTRKVVSPVTRNITRRIIRIYLAWELAVNAAVILTEDLNHGQNIEGIRVLNPFLPDSTEARR